MLNHLRPFSALLLAAPLLLASCDKDDDDTNDGGDPIQPTARVYVVNQGNFTRANAAVTRFDTNNKTTVRDQFGTANPGVALGDVAQSMTLNNGAAYIVVNNSNRIVVADAATLRQTAEITGLEQPRYLCAVGGKGYVTEWGATFGGPGRVREFDLSTNALTGRSAVVGPLPEQIVVSSDGHLVVANSGANSLSIISPADLSVRTQPVADAPTWLQLDGQNRVWVLCGGAVTYNGADIDTAASTVGNLVRLNAGLTAADLTLPFTQKGNAPANLARNGDGSKLYYTYAGNVFTLNTTDNARPRTALVRRSFGALGIDPVDGTLYAADQRSYTADGRVLRYQPSGAVIDSFGTAVGPTQFVF